MSDIVDELLSIASTGWPGSATAGRAAAEIRKLREELRWIPVTEQLPPHNTYVDFLSMDGDGYGKRGLSKEDCEKYGLSLPYDLIPKIYENETGPYILGKDQQGYWEVTHWRLRPGTEPDFDKFIKENR